MVSSSTRLLHEELANLKEAMTKLALNIDQLCQGQQSHSYLNVGISYGEPYTLKNEFLKLDEMVAGNSPQECPSPFSSIENPNTNPASHVHALLPAKRGLESQFFGGYVDISLEKLRKLNALKLFDEMPQLDAKMPTNVFDSGILAELTSQESQSLSSLSTDPKGLSQAFEIGEISIEGALGSNALQLFDKLPQRKIVGETEENDGLETEIPSSPEEKEKDLDSQNLLDDMVKPSVLFDGANRWVAFDPGPGAKLVGSTFQDDFPLIVEVEPPNKSAHYPFDKMPLSSITDVFLNIGGPKSEVTSTFWVGSHCPPQKLSSAYLVDIVSTTYHFYNKVGADGILVAKVFDPGGLICIHRNLWNTTMLVSSWIVEKFIVGVGLVALKPELPTMLGLVIKYLQVDLLLHHPGVVFMMSTCDSSHEIHPLGLLGAAWDSLKLISGKLLKWNTYIFDPGGLIDDLHGKLWGHVQLLVTLPNIEELIDYRGIYKWSKDTHAIQDVAIQIGIALMHWEFWGHTWYYGLSFPPSLEVHEWAATNAIDMLNFNALCLPKLTYIFDPGGSVVHKSPMLPVAYCSLLSTSEPLASRTLEDKGALKGSVLIHI